MTRRRYKKFVYDEPPKKFTGEKSAPLSPADISEAVQAHIESICKAHKAGVKSQLAIAAACAKADKEVGRGERGKLLKHIPLSYSLFTKYVKIGKDKRLFEAKIQKNLPPFFSSLYLLTLLTDEQFEQGFEKGILGPKCTRKEVDAYKTSFEESDASDEPRPYLHAAFSLKFMPKNVDALNQELRALADKYGAELILVDDINAEADENYDKRCRKKFLKTARGLIHRNMKRRLKGKPVTNRNLRPHSISLEEILIEDNSMDRDIRSALSMAEVDKTLEEIDIEAVKRTAGPRYFPNPDIPVEEYLPESQEPDEEDLWLVQKNHWERLAKTGSPLMKRYADTALKPNQYGDPLD